MGRVIIQASFQGGSGLPEDVFENVFNFITLGSPVSDDYVQCGLKVINFYIKNSGSGSIGSSLSGLISPRLARLKMYDGGHAIPRPLAGTMTYNFPATGSSPDLPPEVAVCLSYYTDRNAPSHRGRIYLGPLNGNANDGGVVSSSFRAVMRAQALGLVAALGGTDRTAALAAITTSSGLTLPGTPPGTEPQWALFSPKLGTTVAIANGWVDNAFDTQRRRGIKATARVAW